MSINSASAMSLRTQPKDKHTAFKRKQDIPLKVFTLML